MKNNININAGEFNNYEFKFMPISELQDGQYFFHNTKPYQVKDMKMKSESCRRVIRLTDNWTTVYPLSMKVSAIINY